MIEKYKQSKFRKFISNFFKIKVDYGSFENIDSEYDRLRKKGKKVILCTLSARSGTRWLGDVFASHENVTSSTERFLLPESFYRYINFNKLPIDTSGIVRLIKKGIIDDWQENDLTLVISPFFSHGLKKLYDDLSAEKIIFAVNDAKFTVQSIFNKGVFKKKIIKENVDLCTGYQPERGESWSQIFGRVTPSGDEFIRWSKLTRIGKISWWWNRLNTDIYDQLHKIGLENVFFFKLEEADQNFDYYLNMAKQFNLNPKLSEEDFLTIKGKTVRKSDNLHRRWSTLEHKEFTEETKHFGEIYKRLTN